MIAEDLLHVEADLMTIHGLDDWNTNLVMVGPIEPRGNHSLALLAFAEYRAKYNPLARLILAGEIPVSTYIEELRRLVSTLELDGHVLMTGRIRASERKSLYLTADLFLCTCLEERPRTDFRDAFQLRVPVLAVRNHRGADAIRSVAGTPGKLAEEIDALLTDATGRERQIHEGWSAAR